MKYDFLNLVKTNGFKLTTELKEELPSVTYIFGLNGSGKTTLSRFIYDEYNEMNTLVYNTDYVNSNVQIDKVGENFSVDSTPDKNNQKNTYEIIFGEKTFEFNAIIKDAQSNLERKKTELFAAVNFVNDKYSKQSIKSHIDEIKRIDIAKKISAQTDEPQPQEENDFIKRCENYPNIILVNKSIEKCNALIQKIKKINVLIGKYNCIRKKDELNNKIVELNKLGSEIEDDVIVFAGEDFSNDQVKKFYYEMEKEKYGTITEITELVKHNITDDDINYLNKNEINLMNQIILQIGKIIIKMDTFEEIEKLVIIDPFKTKDSDSEEKLIQEYISKYRKFIADEDKISNIASEIIKEEERSKEATNSLIKESKIINEEFEYLINLNLKNLGFNDLEVKIQSSQHTIGKFSKLELLGKDIGKLSEGEKNALGLAYFLAHTSFKLETYKNKSEGFLLVLDDLFDSNDHTKNSYFSKLALKIEGKERNIFDTLEYIQEKWKVRTKIIIMTHHIWTLGEMISNLADGNIDSKSFFKKVKEKNDHVDVIEVSKNENISIARKINIRLFWPIYNRHKCLYCNIINNIWKESDREWEYFVLAVAFVKIYDRIETDFRTELKKYVGIFIDDKIKKTSYDEEAKARIESYIAENREISVDIIREIFEDINYVEPDLFYEYISPFAHTLCKILNNPNGEDLRRLRHNSSLNTNMLGFSINEF